MQVLLVDDEPIARDELRYHLDALGNFTCTEAASVEEALEALRKQNFDVVFLDLRLGGTPGLTLAQILQDRTDAPKIVVVSAFDDQALAAYDRRVTDYILKPIRRERLKETLDRVMPLDTRRVVEDLPVIAVSQEDRTILLDVNEIFFLEAKEEGVYVYTAQESFWSKTSLESMTRRLPKDRFFPCHRSYVVNLQQVREFMPFFNGVYMVRMRDKKRTEVPVSRARARELKGRLGIGAAR